MKNLRLTLIIFSLGISSTAIAMEDSFADKAKPDFDSIQTIFQKMGAFQQMEITLNFDSLLSSRRKDIEHPAQIKLSGAGQADLSLKLKVRPRGRYRRVRCDWPPLRLNFSGTELKGLNVYHKYDKLKLVTHCQDAGIDAQTLLKEYWTYKLYNEVSDSSFRVHLLEVTYIDANDATRTMESYAFVIENSQEMAHRINGELVDGLGTKTEAVGATSYQHMILFNYMIGNKDWKLSTQKNLKLVRHKNSQLFTIVPYDFDYSNIVNSAYLSLGEPNHVSVEENAVFSGSFNDKTSLEHRIQEFKRLGKYDFFCFKKCELLKKAEKNKMHLLIKSFLKTIKNKQKLAAIFIGMKIK